MRPAKKIHELDWEDLKSINLMPYANMIMIEIINHNLDEETESGILKCSDDDFNPHGHMESFGKVFKVPEFLYYDKEIFYSNESMTWKTEVEVKEGDDIWFSRLQSGNCDIIKFKNHPNEIRIIPYSDTYLARRGDKVWGLNGYCAFTPIKQEKLGSLDILDKEDDIFKGICKYLGSHNVEYRPKPVMSRATGDVKEYIHDSDNIDLEIGDEVRFLTQYRRVLEPEGYEELGEKLYIAQRKELAFVYKDEPKNI